MRALVVDDSRAIRGIIAKIMRSFNFETIEVANGREAMESLERDRPFDVVTVNWEMPVMDGLEFVAAVRGDHRFRKLPLLMISSEADQGRVALAMRKGVDQYIVKPCTPKSIAQKLTAMGLSVTGCQEPGVISSASSADAKAAIRVLLVDDSAVVRRVLKTTLETCEGIKVVGAARDGLEGIELVRELRPDAVLLDVDMPRLDGLGTLRQLRDENLSVPVVMFSSHTERGAKTATDALLLGAKDFVFKPGGAGMSNLQAGQQAILEEIVPRLRWLTRRRVIGGQPTSVPSGTSRPKSRVDLVVVAASTGGPAALAQLVNDQQFCASLQAPVVIAQHMPSLFTLHLANRLARDSGLDIAEAVDGEVLKPGMIRIAPGGRHTVVQRKGIEFVTVLHDEQAVNSCRPSADVLFLSASTCAEQHLLAVVLTGMGHDGRRGCRCVREAGGRVLVQDEVTSVVWGMPGSVAKEGLADMVLPIEKIGPQVASSLRFGRHD